MTVDSHKLLCLGKIVRCLGENYSELSDTIQRLSRDYEEFLEPTDQLNYYGQKSQ